MEQVRTIAKQAREHWFWIVCASILLVGLVTWFLVTSGMSQETSDRVTELTGRRSTVQQVLNAGVTPEDRMGHFHPNDITYEKMAEQIDTLKQSVLEAWDAQQSSQGERVFSWPVVLKEDFRNKVAAITSRTEPNGEVVRLSIEEAIPFPLPSDKKLLLDVSSRQIYGSYIRNELPKLAARIKSNWGTAEDPANARPMVWWEPNNQQYIATRRFDWSEQDDGAPNTLQVFYAQEDLRVLEALMDIIAETNKDATADFNAVIKRIESIHLGRDASRAAGSIKKLGVTPGAGQDGGGLGSAAPGFGAGDDGGGFDGGGGFDDGGGGGFDDGGGGGFDDGGGDGFDDGGGGGFDDGGGFDESGGGGFDDSGGFDAGGSTPTSTSQDPAHLRYVDLNYQPLAAQTLRDSFTSEDPAIAKLAVAKRLPVRMRIVIDQRRLDDLLAACGNSSLTVEVRQVRLNPQSGNASNNSGGSGGGGGFEELSGGGGAARPQRDKNTQFDVTIELYGIVYIYNPVDTKKWGVPQDATVEGEEAAPLPEDAA